jgi:hypothetical protein
VFEQECGETVATEDVCVVVPTVRTTPVCDDTEPSIEDYMASLLERVRKKSQGIVDDAPAAAVELVTEPEIAQSEPPIAPLAEPPIARHVARGRAAELPADLAAMRELARAHAIAVIAQHGRTRVKIVAAFQALIALAAFSMAVVLTRFSQQMPVMFLPRILFFAVAIVWGTQSAHGMSQIVRGRRPWKRE